MKATKTIIIAILLTAGLLMGCGDSRTDLMLSSIDTLMNNHPDSALYMLDSLKAEKPHWPKSQRMRYDLLHLKAENKADVLLKTPIPSLSNLLTTIKDGVVLMRKC